MFILVIIFIAMVIIIWVLILEKKGDPKYLEQDYRHQKPSSTHKNKPL